MPSYNEPSPSAIESWIGLEQTRLVEIQDRIRPLREEERQISDRIARLKDLLSAYTVSPVGSGLVTVGASDHDGGIVGSLADGTPIRLGQRPLSVRERVLGQVREILEDADEPMHILAIYDEFKSRGFEVPGAGKAANITAHLSGAQDIVSPNRGFYRLRAQDEAAPAKKTATKKRTVKRRKTSGKK